MYSKSELYEGNRDGRPLDPGMYAASMAFHFGGKKEKKAPKAPVQQNVTIADEGKKVKKPTGSRKRTNLKSLRIDRQLVPGMNTASMGSGLTY